MPTENQNITNLNVVTGAKLEEALTQIWTAMKQYIHDETIDAELRTVIMARLATLINKPSSYTWESIISQVQYLENFKTELAQVCEEKGLYVSDLELIQWISAIRMALGVFGCYIYAVDDNDTEHFYTKAEWEVLKTQAQQQLITLPDVYGVVINNSSATRIVACTTRDSRQWGTYSRTTSSGSGYNGDGGTRAILRDVDPVEAYYLMNDSAFITIVNSYSQIRTEDYPQVSHRWVVMESQGQNVVTANVYINRGTSANPRYAFVETGNSEIGTTMETFAATTYAWSGTSLGAGYSVPFKDTNNLYGHPSGKYCANYKAFEGDTYQWYEPTQSELALLCANNSAAQDLCTSVGFSLPSGSIWSCVQSNGNYANYTNFPSGSTVNGSKNNSTYVVPFAAFRRGLA